MLWSVAVSAADWCPAKLSGLGTHQHKLNALLWALWIGSHAMVVSCQLSFLTKCLQPCRLLAAPHDKMCALWQSLLVCQAEGIVLSMLQNGRRLLMHNLDIRR